MPKASGNNAGAPPKAAAANGTAVPLPKHRKPRRIYKEAVNKNRFGCRGRLITGPDRKYFWLAFIMIVIPGIAFLAAVYVPPVAQPIICTFHSRFLPIFTQCDTEAKIFARHERRLRPCLPFLSLPLTTMTV